MTPDKVTELAQVAGFTPAQVSIYRSELQRFAELVRNEAFEEAIGVLGFHGFDDVVPYIRWAAVNKRSKT